MNLVRFDGRIPVVSIDQAELDKRNELIAKSDAVQPITEPSQEAFAVSCGIELSRLLKLAESSRKELKAPVLEVGKQIDQIAADYSTPIQQALDRVSSIVARWQESEKQRIIDEEKRKHEEFIRLEQERYALENQAKDLTKSIDSDETLDLAIKAEQEAIKAKTLADMAMTIQVAPICKSKGSVSGTEKFVEVLDVHALYKARPELVKLEAKVGAIKAVWSPGIEIPGVRCWQEAKASFRS